ncbi:hypothetical protein FOL47_010634 [Perkinsus chesapeaki]|uniref:Uncharacterized protein n=1 Tax=Perkinsus chesapeaki TaxID=330153 RepID=A0A7J6MP64_PERCH|nr:hypothetical protein FOL47_010634 [Perkinsus chesapeaki]
MAIAIDYAIRNKRARNVKVIFGLSLDDVKTILKDFKDPTGKIALDFDGVDSDAAVNVMYAIEFATMSYQRRLEGPVYSKLQDAYDLNHPSERSSSPRTRSEGPGATRRSRECPASHAGLCGNKSRE